MQLKTKSSWRRQLKNLTALEWTFIFSVVVHGVFIILFSIYATDLQSQELNTDLKTERTVSKKNTTNSVKRSKQQVSEEQPRVTETLPPTTPEYPSIPVESETEELLTYEEITHFRDNGNSNRVIVTGAMVTEITSTISDKKSSGGIGHSGAQHPLLEGEDFQREIILFFARTVARALITKAVFKLLDIPVIYVASRRHYEVARSQAKVKVPARVNIYNQRIKYRHKKQLYIGGGQHAKN